MTEVYRHFGFVDAAARPVTLLEIDAPVGFEVLEHVVPVLFDRRVQVVTVLSRRCRQRDAHRLSMVDGGGSQRDGAELESIVLNALGAQGAGAQEERAEGIRVRVVEP